MDGDDDGGGDADAGHPRHKPPLRNYLPPRSHRRSPPDPDSDDSERNLDEDEDSDEGERNRSDHSGSSPDSRGKRRKLDRYTLGFEFAPRKPPTPPPPPPAAARAAVPPNPKPNASKNYAPDWSEDSTFVLLDAWGDLFVKNDRKLLRSDEWSEVAEKVNRASRTVRSESQCRNRIDTLKKKYKKEKARLAEYPDSKGDWVYFAKMDFLMPQQAAAADAPPARLPCGVDAGEYVFSDSRVYTNRANGVNEMGDSPGDTGSEDEEEEEDESDGLPPATTMAKRKGENLASFRMLADSIKKFGDIYEKIEIGKRKQMAELERMRNEFQRDLEVQKRQILERAQAEIARMRQEEREEEGGEERTDGDGDGVGHGGAVVDDDMDGSA